MFIASLFPQILHYDVNLPSMHVFDVILKDKGRNVVEQNAMVPNNSSKEPMASLGIIASESRCC